MVVDIGRVDFDSMDKKIKIDKKDEQILKLLSEDARTPLTKIAKEVRLSRDAVDYRIKRLEKEGVILKFFANLNYEKLGYYLFHVFLLIDEIDQKAQDTLISYLKSHPNIFSIIEYNDRWDIEMVLIAKTLREFDKLILDISSKYPDIIIDKDKVEIIKRYSSKYYPKKITSPIKEYDGPAFEVDATDIKILRLLSQDCRKSTYEIGEKVGLSGDAVRYRIKHLVKEDIILKFTCLINLSLLGYHWYTFTMEVKTFDHSHEKKFEEFLHQHPEIVRSAKTLGGWDLLLYMAVKSPKDYHQLVKNIKNTFSSIVRNYQTWVGYHEHAHKTMPETIGK